MLLSLGFIGLPGYTEWIIISIFFAVMFYWIKTIIHVAKHEFNPPNQKIIWLLIVIFLGVPGAFIYDIAGRKNIVGQPETN